MNENELTSGEKGGIFSIDQEMANFSIFDSVDWFLN